MSHSLLTNGNLAMDSYGVGVPALSSRCTIHVNETMRLLRSETVRALILALEVKKGKMLIFGLFSAAKAACKKARCGPESSILVS